MTYIQTWIYKPFSWKLSPVVYGVQVWLDLQRSKSCNFRPSKANPVGCRPVMHLAYSLSFFSNWETHTHTAQTHVCVHMHARTHTHLSPLTHTQLCHMTPIDICCNITQSQHSLGWWCSPSSLPLLLLFRGNRRGLWDDSHWRWGCD